MLAVILLVYNIFIDLVGSSLVLASELGSFVLDNYNYSYYTITIVTVTIYGRRYDQQGVIREV